MTKPPYDPRAVANLLLDLAAKEEDASLPISNLALQKLLYLAHGHFLIRTGTPLVQGAFEAWTYGPVHPAVYQAFKSEADRPIKIRAVGRNAITGEAHQLPIPTTTKSAATYGKFSGRMEILVPASLWPSPTRLTGRGRRL